MTEDTPEAGRIMRDFGSGETYSFNRIFASAGEHKKTA